MSNILTVRLLPEELGSCDARAAALGMTRTDYIRHLIRTDLSGGKPGRARKRRFASRDLIGSVHLGHGSANPDVRAALAGRVRRA